MMENFIIHQVGKMVIEKKTNIQAVCKDCAEKLHKEWQLKNKGTKIGEGDFVKIGVNDNGKIEHMWFRITMVVTDKEFFGELNNIPVLIKNIQYKDEILIKFEEIEALIKNGNRKK